MQNFRALGMGDSEMYGLEISISGGLECRDCGHEVQGLYL